MKKMNIEKAKAVNGGGKKHYHWLCTKYNFRSTRYDSYADALAAANNHVAGYPTHLGYTYVIECTGNC